MNIMSNLELKMAELKATIREGASKAIRFCDENKELLIVAVPVVGGAVTAGVKAAGKHHNLRKAEKIKKNFCYDRSLGHYWELRRELTNHEWIEIDRRRKRGERLADILSSMRVLK